MFNGFLLRDDSKKPYKFFIKSSTDAFTVSVATFKEVFSSFGETELENYLESNFPHARRRDIGIIVVDPVSGETVKLKFNPKPKPSMKQPKNLFSTPNASIW